MICCLLLTGNCFSQHRNISLSDSDSVSISVRCCLSCVEVAIDGMPAATAVVVAFGGPDCVTVCSGGGALRGKYS